MLKLFDERVRRLKFTSPQLNVSAKESCQNTVQLAVQFEACRMVQNPFYYLNLAINYFNNKYYKVQRFDRFVGERG